MAISSNAQYVLLSSSDGKLNQSITPYNIISVNGNIHLNGLGSMNFSNNGSGLIWGGGTSQIMDDSDLRIKTDDTMHFFTANTQRMLINPQGYVGIGTASPEVPLHVNTSTTSTGNKTGRYFTPTGGALTVTGTISSPAISIKATGYIWTTQGFIAASDKRIKYNIQDIQDIQFIPSINILRYLKPRIFNYIDDINNGTDPKWGFIAQEVKEIIPNAVTYTADFIPNIFEVAEIIGKEIKLMSKTTTELLKDENGYYPLQLKNTKGDDIIVNITEIVDENTFKIDQEIETEHNKVFVYGQKVPDFHLLDKDQIFTITTAAVQEIDKELQETKNRVKLLEEENQQLKQQIAEILERLTKANI
jgi:hypothetical protein